MKAPALALAWALGAALAAAPSDAPARARNAYRAAGDCAGLPRVELAVASGFCVGLAAQGLGTPRGVLPLPDGRVLVTDRGGWERGRGRLLRLTRRGDRYEAEVLLTGLNRPHGLQFDPAGRIHVAEDDRISRLDDGRRLVPIISGLPHDGLHPLKSFVFDRDGALLVAVGSASNNCEPTSPRAAPASATDPSARLPDAARRAACPEADGPEPRGAVWRFEQRGETWTRTVHARGLRNAIALAVEPRSGTLWAADNGSDGLGARSGGRVDDEAAPHDPLQRVRAGAHFGWPYCYDARIPSPEFPSADCRAFAAPVRLLPAHSAPLGMTFYANAAEEPPWRDALVVALHGYRRAGHRIAGYAVDARGQPIGPLRMLVAGWHAVEGRRPMGAPVDIKAAADGTLWVTDDRNGALLAISPVPRTASRSP